jgi:type IV pilus assembly protein PilY1
VELGGVGEVLLNREEPRNIYSILCGDYTHHQPFTHNHNAFLKNNNRITPELIGVANDAEKDQIVDFVHGYDAYDEDGDGNTSEKRDWILGAFIHSRPEIVHYDATTSVIYAGANDGMLHAFDDATGEELWAFIPPDLLGSLKGLGGSTLEYSVDGPAKAYVMDNDSDGTIEAGDRVILVFGERRGGNQFYALDVTVPTAPSVIWRIGPDLLEFSEMGQTWGTPVFGRTGYGNKTAVFLSGGYDPGQDGDPVIGDTMGRGIYVVDLLSGTLIRGFTIDTEAEMTWSIPSDLAVVDTTDSGYVDRAYVGDMGGRVWRFDMAGEDPAEWDAQILFDANSPAHGGRKIFYPPDVLLEPGYEMVVFGTGDRANPNKHAVVNRIYVVKDRQTGMMLDEGSLIDVTDNLLQDPHTSAGAKASLRADLDNGMGYYVTLDEHPGEKVLAPPLTFFGTVYATTHTPNLDAEVDPCVPQTGTARLYALDYQTGEARVNFNPANDTGDSDVLDRSDRSLVIGESIPSMMVIAMIGADAAGFVGVSSGIFKADLSGYTPLVRIYWRQFS